MKVTCHYYGGVYRATKPPAIVDSAVCPDAVSMAANSASEKNSPCATPPKGVVSHSSSKTKSSRIRPHTYTFLCHNWSSTGRRVWLLHLQCFQTTKMEMVRIHTTCNIYLSAWMVSPQFGLSPAPQFGNGTCIMYTCNMPYLTLGCLA